MTVLPDDGLSLAAEFPDATHAQWQRLVEGVLRKTGTEPVSGAAAEEALFTPLQDGIVTRPLYTAEQCAAPENTGHPGFTPYVRGALPEGNSLTGWDVRQQHGRPDPAQTNEALLADLEHGVNSLWLTLGEGALPVEGLATALEGVLLDLAPIVLDAGEDFAAAAHALFALYERRGLPGHAALGNLGADPLGCLARSGDDSKLTSLTAEAVALARRCHGNSPGLRALTVDALPYHQAGGSPAQELGYSLATGVAYLRDLTAAGLDAESACAQLEFRYSGTADQFLTIAKLRAARRLWARVAEACGVSSGAAAQRQHVVTSPVMLTRRDPWVNILRGTIATMSAGLGGADTVTVLPFDHAVGQSDEFARRIARNTSAILLEESHLAQVIDPAGGSWYVEQLTDELAHAAWAWFQEIERAGGQAAALGSGMVAERLRETWQQRSRDLARRKEPITGVSEFPNLAESPLEREPAPTPTASGGLPRVRRDEAFEALRSRSDAHLAAHGVRPRVFLAALGLPAAHTVRVGFVTNLLQAGGIEPVHDPVTVDSATAGAAFTDSGAALACLCSNDSTYAEQAEAVAEALKAAGARRVYLAGKPGERAEALRTAGVDEFLYAGGDVVAWLSSALDEMGVA